MNSVKERNECDRNFKHSDDSDAKDDLHDWTRVFKPFWRSRNIDNSNERIHSFNKSLLDGRKDHSLDWSFVLFLSIWFNHSLKIIIKTAHFQVINALNCLYCSSHSNCFIALNLFIYFLKVFSKLISYYYQNCNEDQSDRDSISKEKIKQNDWKNELSPIFDQCRQNFNHCRYFFDVRLKNSYDILLFIVFDCRCRKSQRFTIDQRYQSWFHMKAYSCLDILRMYSKESLSCLRYCQIKNELESCPELHPCFIYVLNK